MHICTKHIPIFRKKTAYTKNKNECTYDCRPSWPGGEILNIYHYLHLRQRRILNAFSLFGDVGNVLYTEKYNSFKYKIIFLKIYI